MLPSNVDENGVKDCQTDSTSDYIAGLEMENASLCREKLKLNSFNENSFREDNDKVMFYTGIQNSSNLLCLFHFIKNSSPEVKSSPGILNKSIS